MRERTCSIGTLTFRVYNESPDKQFVNVEVVSDDGEVGNIDCSLREWHALQDAGTRSLRARSLTPEDREALEWLIKHVNATTIPGVRPRADKQRALSVLARLIDEGKP